MGAPKDKKQVAVETPVVVQESKSQHDQWIVETPISFVNADGYSERAEIGAIVSLPASVANGLLINGAISPVTK